MIYKFDYQVFIRKRDNLRIFISEILILLGLFGFYPLISDKSEDEITRTRATWLILYMFLGNMGLHIVMILIEEIKNLISYIVLRRNLIF